MNLCDASAGCFRPPSSWIKERGWSNKHVFAQGISANGIAAYFEEADPTLLGTLLAQFVVVATAEVHRSVFQGGGKAAAFRAQGGGEGRRRGGGMQWAKQGIIKKSRGEEGEGGGEEGEEGEYEEEEDDEEEE